MDLHLIPNATATPAEREAIDAALGASPPARHLLLPALRAAQARVGWITEGALNHICQRLDVPPAEAYGVASFYALLSLTPRAPLVAHVCDDVACRANGAERICRELESRLGPARAPALDGSATWLRSPCLGHCEQAPVAFFQSSGEAASEWIDGHVTADAIQTSLSSRSQSRRSPANVADSVPQIESDPDALRLLRRAGRVDPSSLAAYRSNGGYAALARAIEMGRDAVIREVTSSRLVGRGGAAFPTGRKWEAVAQAAATPHYMVCNADESEPGTFKDRVLMEEDPFAVIEAMTIAAFATRCEQGFVYVRGEYPLASARLDTALADARRSGFLGADVAGAGFRFDVELRRGAGAYICGEETALFNSIEGFRGEPRNKPPFPVHAGLFAKPTVINNVETLVAALDIILDGASRFAAIGSDGSTGTKLFCVSGCVRQPGLYEVPFATTLRTLVDLAGGLRAGRSLQAVLVGGAAGVFLTPRELDMPLTFEGARAAGATLGSGGVMVLDDSVDLQDVVLRIAEFFRDESCGQCVPCRVGTVRQEEALHRLAARRPLGSGETEVALIDDLALAMKDASICGLGHTASTAIQSAIRKLGAFTS
jgi:NADH-quinone oxidoreductase subunit F